MKKIIIVEADNEYPIKRILIDYHGRYLPHEVEFTEIQLPSEEEIIQNEHLIIDEYENVSKDQKWFMGVGFRLCATWLLNKMKGE